MLFVLIGALLPAPSRAEEYTFDVSEFEKKPYEIGGYLEAGPAVMGFDSGSALYKLRFRGGDEAYEYTAGVLLDGSFEEGMVAFFVEVDASIADSTAGPYSRAAEIFEGYMRLAPSEALSLYFGKRALRWGKGYAWNPVGFVERPKDTNDPNLAREGFVMLAGDYTMSFGGPLRTLSLSPVLLPIHEDINDEFGGADGLNFAGKVYLLLYDTDIDLLFLTGKSRPDRYGVDFSMNITTNLEIHGEFAYIKGFGRKSMDAAGNVSGQLFDAKSYLLGARYLTSSDTTYILEYYRNGTGFETDDMRDFFSFVDAAYDKYLLTGDESLLGKADSLSNSYIRQNPMRDYLYLRVSRKEPFDVLYLTPAITGILNLHDSSCSLSPEVTYTGITDLELRFKAVYLAGERESEYGEKFNDYMVEFRARYYF